LDSHSQETGGIDRASQGSAAFAAVWLDGQLLLDRPEARELVQDQGLLRGWGVFETMLAVDGRLHLWEAHAARLLRGLEQIGLAPPPISYLEQGLEDVLDKARSQPSREAHHGRGPRADSRVGGQPPRDHPTDSHARPPRCHRLRVTVTAGDSPALWWQPGSVRVLITAHPCPAPPDLAAGLGLRVVTYPEPIQPHGPLQGCKHTSYLPWILAARWAAAAGADESLVVNGRGHVSETSCRNVFFLIGQVVVTPDLPSGCLDGVMRRTVLELASTAGIEVQQRPVPKEELGEVRQACLTSATTGMQWVADLDGRPLERPRSGPLVDLAAGARAVLVGQRAL